MVSKSKHPLSKRDRSSQGTWLCLPQEYTYKFALDGEVFPSDTDVVVSVFKGLVSIKVSRQPAGHVICWSTGIDRLTLISILHDRAATCESAEHQIIFERDAAADIHGYLLSTLPKDFASSPKAGVGHRMSLSVEMVVQLIKHLEQAE
jgi:hypothetical protein